MVQKVCGFDPRQPPQYYPSPRIMGEFKAYDLNVDHKPF